MGKVTFFLQEMPNVFLFWRIHLKYKYIFTEILKEPESINIKSHFLYPSSFLLH